MFTKVNAKQEQFLWLLVDGQTQEQAYASVYGEAKSRDVCATNASRMLRNANVLARRNEIIAQRMAQQPITAKFLTGELLGVAGEARSIGQGSAAVAAYQTIAKLHGLLVDKLQVDALVRKPSESPESPAEMSEEDWLTKYGVVNLLPEAPTSTQPIVPHENISLVTIESEGSEPVVEE
jgi:hypothetical protein